jgi:hypothetical protein
LIHTVTSINFCLVFLFPLSDNPKKGCVWC